MTLRWRLTFMYAAATAVLFVASAAIAELAYARGMTLLTDRALRSAIDETTDILESPEALDPDSLRARLTSFSDSSAGLFLTIRDAKGAMVYQSDANISALPTNPPPDAVGDRVAFTTVSFPKVGAMRVASVFLPAVSSGLWVEMGMPLPFPLQAVSSREARVLGLFFFCLIAAVGGAGWLISGRALAPIESIAAVAETVSRGALHERIPLDGRSDELGRLIAVLNEMLGHIEASSKKLGEFAANVSHQLKTPLTVMRGEIEVALRADPEPKELASVLRSNLADLEALSRVVADMLAYSRMDEGKAAAPAFCPLDEFLKEVARKAQILGKPRSQAVELDMEPVSALFDRARLEQALLNVVENAIKHTPSGGRIVLRLRRAGASARIEVEDQGPGVPAEDLPRLFERGYSRGGTGLGLGLARALVESMSGTIEISSPGRGLLVRVLVPAPTQR